MKNALLALFLSIPMWGFSQTENEPAKIKIFQPPALTRVSVNSKAEEPPLCVLDGELFSFNNKTEFDEKLKSIDPNSIQSIDVLKEASATTIYGEKGKNGVIVITSKKK